MQIADLIRRAALRYNDATAFVFDGQELSFAEFDDVTNRLANALLAKGLHPGDRVAVLLPNSLDSVVTFYAIAKAGLVRVPLNTKENVDDVAFKLDDSQARGFVTWTDDAEDVDVVIRQGELAGLTAAADPTPCRIARALDDPLRFAYTGGTTGRPKAVLLSTRNELVLLRNLGYDLLPGLDRTDTMLHAAPLTHGSGGMLLPHFLRGSRNVILDGFDAGTWLAAAERYNATSAFVVPTMLAKLTEDPGVSAANLAFRRLVYSGSPIAAPLLERSIAMFGNVLVQTYGQSEAPLALTCLQPGDHARLTSAGQPYTFVDVEIHDEDGNRVGVGEPGEVVTRGEHVMLGYWQRPEANASALDARGWLRTGDIGQWDERGFLYLLDRKHDLIISGGYNVYPREVEDVLMSHPAVVAAAVFGLPDEVWGQVVSAAVVLREPVEMSTLGQYCKLRMAAYKAPRFLEQWPELPQSAVGKSLRREVQETVIRNRDAVASSPS